MRHRFEARSVRASPADDVAEYDGGFTEGYRRGWDDQRSGKPGHNPERSDASWREKGDHQGYGEGWLGAWADSRKRGDTTGME